MSTVALVLNTTTTVVIKLKKRVSKKSLKLVGSLNITNGYSVIDILTS